MNARNIPDRKLNPPNVLSAFRLVAAPVLLYLAWTGRSDLFLGLLAASLLTDTLDGFLARRYRATSSFGSRLDSWGDFATYMTVPLGAWWLWPTVLRREAPFVLLVIAAYAAPSLAGFIKFKRLPGYHTWAAKITGVLISLAAFLLFIFDMVWPFRVAAVLLVLEACEEIAITWCIVELKGPVPSYWHATRMSKNTSTLIE